MRRRLSFICFVLLVVLTGCIDLTDVMLADKGVDEVEVDEITVSEVPEEIKDLIWQDYERLVERLLALGEGDTRNLEELLIRIQARREQDEYYGKYVLAGGIAIVGARTLTEETMLEAGEIVEIMTQKQPEVRDYLSPERGFYFAITDPEYTRGHVKTLPESPVWELAFLNGPPVFVNIGMCLFADGKFVCTAPASKMVQIKSTEQGEDCGRFWCDFNIYIYDWTTLTHEMAHAVEYAANKFDDSFRTELLEAYANAKVNDLWNDAKANDYAMKNYKEYWAVASEYWFFNFKERNLRSGEYPDGIIVPAHTREDLLERDPKIYALLEKWYPEVEPFGTH